MEDLVTILFCQLIWLYNGVPVACARHWLRNITFSLPTTIKSSTRAQKKASLSFAVYKALAGSFLPSRRSAFARNMQPMVFPSSFTSSRGLPGTTTLYR